MQEQNDWCEQWAAQPDAKARRQMLNAARQTEKESNALLADELWTIRFGKDGVGIPDGFFAWWLTAQCAANQSTGFFAKGRLQKVYAAGLGQLGLSWAEQNGEAARRLLYADLLQMMRQYVASCTQDSAYGSFAFGLMTMKKKALAEKIAKELTDVSVRLPLQIGMEAAYAPLARAAARAFSEAFNGEPIPQELEAFLSLKQTPNQER